MPDSASTVRMDKWLWAARFFKTRALAAKACELGRIHSNRIQAKPARDVRIGDRLLIKNDAGEFEIDVLALSEVRPRRRGSGPLPGDRDEPPAPPGAPRRQKGLAAV